MKRLLIPSLLFLGACATPVEKVVTQAIESPTITVQRVDAPPSKLRVSPPKFQSPSDKTSVIALDQENYTRFRLFLIAISEREEDWKTRLNVANDHIDTLTKKNPIQAE